MSTETRTQLETEFAEYWERELKGNPSADYTTCEAVWIAARTKQ